MAYIVAAMWRQGRRGRRDPRHAGDHDSAESSGGRLPEFIPRQRAMIRGRSSCTKFEDEAAFQAHARRSTSASTFLAARCRASRSASASTTRRSTPERLSRIAAVHLRPTNGSGRGNGVAGGARRDARVLAGGTDLIIRLRDRTLQPTVVVDVKRIPEFAPSIDGGGGAAAHLGRHDDDRHLRDSPFMRATFPR